MAIRVHELHPMLVHAPLVMLPAAATVDLLSVSSSGRLRRSAYSAIGPIMKVTPCVRGEV